MTKNKMSVEQAIRILHPDTTVEALAEIGYYAGFRSQEAELEAVNEACSVTVFPAIFYFGRHRFRAKEPPKKSPRPLKE